MNRMYNGIVDEKLIKEIIEGADKTGDVRAMCIWGAFGDEVPRIHLGHLHMMNKLCDLGKGGIRVNIFINEEPVPENRDLQNILKQHTKTTVSMLHVLSELMAGGVGLESICVGSEETDRLRREHSKDFSRSQKALEKARREIEEMFMPLQEESQPISDEVIRKFQPKICKSLELEERAYRELVELFVIRNKAHASTQWASDFGATLQLMEKKPSFLIVGERHGYIWALYNCMFRHARLEQIPVIRVENFMDCIGRKPMNSRDPENCIGLDDSEEIMRVKFLKGARLANTQKVFALRDVFEKLLFTRRETISINNCECVSYRDVLNEWNDRVVVDVAISFLKRSYSSVVPVLSSIVLAQSSSTRFAVDNHSILNHIAEDLPAEDREQVINLDKSVNREPQHHREIYDMILDDAILRRILDLRTIDPLSAKDPLIKAAFDKAKELIRATRDMDILPYQIAKRHRDHYYHQINVGGLGAKLLDIHNSTGVPLWKHMAETLGVEGGNGLKERKVKAIWWIAALLHDHAYALEHAFTFFPNLLVLQKYVATNPVAVEEAFEAHQKLLRPMMTNDLAKKVFEPLYQNDTEKARQSLVAMVRRWLAYIPTVKDEEVADICDAASNHGVMGAVNLLSHISSDRLEGEWKHAFGAIAAAILVHHLPKRPLIQFERCPLSFLLAFVDEIQEWSRLHVYNGVYKACLEKIELGLFSRPWEKPSNLIFTEFLEVVFPFENEEMLSDIDWNRERFHQDKIKGLGRLVPPGPKSENGFPQKISWREVYLSGNKPE